MTDERLRALERRFRETESVEDEVAWLTARLRCGEISQERIELAAACGLKSAACLARGRPSRRELGRLRRRTRIPFPDVLGTDEFEVQLEKFACNQTLLHGNGRPGEPLLTLRLEHLVEHLLSQGPALLCYSGLIDGIIPVSRDFSCRRVASYLAYLWLFHDEPTEESGWGLLTLAQREGRWVLQVVADEDIEMFSVTVHGSEELTATAARIAGGPGCGGTG